MNWIRSTWVALTAGLFVGLGLSAALAAGTAARMEGNNILTPGSVTSSVGSGSDAFIVATDGARTHIGTDANSYLDCAGTSCTFHNLMALPSNATTCTLNGATPSTCTATVTAGAICVCSDVGGSAAVAAGGCAVSLASTTLTVTGSALATNVVNIWCNK